MKKLYFFCLILIGNIALSAQQSNIKKCAADELHDHKMQDPAYAEKFNTLDRLVREQSKLRSPSCTNPLIIPIAVHFGGTITTANMACINDVVEDQIDILNEDFGGYNTDIVTYCNSASSCPTDYPPNALGGGTCIQFCLATLNHPAGESMTNGGANLVNGDPAYTFDQYTFDTDAAPWSGYFNIFVHSTAPIDNSTGMPYTSLLGLAPLPGGNNPDGNGMYITPSAFGGDAYSCISGSALNNSSSYNLGRTATHEAGHYFGLPHTFAGNSCSADDNFAQTPNQEFSNGGVPTIDLNNCTSSATSCGTNDFFFNYMDYSNDIALYMFTSDQSDHMNTIATAAASSGNPYKASATTCGTVPTNYTPTYPTGCPVGLVPESVFSINATAPYEVCLVMNQVQFLDESLNFPSSWAWTFSGAGVSPSSSSDQNPVVTVGSTGMLTVTLTATNNSGSDATPETMTYSIVILPGSDCDNCGETFTDTGGSGGNYQDDEDEVWTLCVENPGDKLQVNFTTIDLGTAAFEDVLLVTNGTVEATSNSDCEYLLMLSNVYINNGGGSFGGTSNTIVSTGDCMTFRFLSDDTGNTAGWIADVTCIVDPCTNGIQDSNEEFVDCGDTSSCPDCPTACDGFTFYDAGGANSTAGEDQQQWTICADEIDETVTLDFTTIDMMPWNNGVLRIYEGDITLNGGNINSFKYYISGDAIYYQDGGLVNLNSTTVTSPGDCYTFFYSKGASSNTGNGNGWVANVSCNAALPLSIISFEGTILNKTIQLSWETITEINIDKFDIEKSYDNSHYTKLSEFTACGNCLDGQKYNYIDTDVDRGINSYRLKIIDNDGSYTYSNTIQVSLDRTTNDWSIYPNPGKGQFTIDNIGSQVQSIKVIDKLGREVYTHMIDVTNDKMDISLDNLQAGYYQLVLIGDHISSKPLVVLP